MLGRPHGAGRQAGRHGQHRARVAVVAYYARPASWPWLAGSTESGAGRQAGRHGQHTIHVKTWGK